mmetsp:Transcript_24563/g.37372  ORF Transcript_24563/g.37372 Transcript_24563/m.37372 type:complete len:85 (-) Transcript_24563:103-357(-)
MEKHTSTSSRWTVRKVDATLWCSILKNMLPLRHLRTFIAFRQPPQEPLLSNDVPVLRLGTEGSNPAHEEDLMNREAGFEGQNDH